MKDRGDHEKSLAIVARVIRAWDPYDLIAGGAPADEFDDEIARLVARVSGREGIDDIATAISAVFSEAFEPDGFSPVDCFRTAQQIHSELRRAGLLPAGQQLRRAE